MSALELQPGDQKERSLRTKTIVLVWLLLFLFCVKFFVLDTVLRALMPLRMLRANVPAAYGTCAESHDVLMSNAERYRFGR